jgi:cytoskeletal protein RodZ
MQENNFEKNVKQKLDELSLTPSEPVWKKVEAAIQKKRKRRLAFLLLPFLLAAGGALWWMLVMQQPEKQIHTNSNTPDETNSTFSKPHATTPADVPAANATGKMPADALSQKGSDAITINHDLKKTTPQKTTLTAYTNRPKEINVQSASKQATAEKGKEKSRNSTAAVAPANTDGLDSPASETAPINTDTTAKENPVEDSAQKAIVITADSMEKAVPQKVVKLQAKRKLQWQVAARVGGSNTIAPLSIGSGLKSLEESRQPSQNYGGGNYFPGPTSGLQSSWQPAAPVTGLHLSVGAIAKRNVGKHRFITAGLQYSYYSNRIAVGERLPADSLAGFLNSSPNSMYEDQSGTGYLFRSTSRSSKSNQFTNAFHVIEIPIGFEYRLLKKLPLQLQHGVAISQLIRSKALQYDSRTNMYYRSKSTLRETAVSVFTAISYTVWSGKSVSFQAGPHMQYGLQSFYKSGSDSHLLSGGITASMGF